MAESETPLSANKQALLKIRELRQLLAQAQDASAYEPVAIVSMACRFPRHATSPERFWQSLIDQTDETGEVPPDRWDLDAFFDEDPEIPGRMYARRGVFLDQVDRMDPEFFGISPREATWVDPQQRLLMEVGWEALERAGWIPEKIGDHTGVFVGWMHNDYQNEASDSFLNLNPYIATGAAGSFLCGRLAYYLGLQGPSLAVDTACSSSLVALHLACQSLQRHDCDRALVGGVNVICSPTTNILTCKLKALSPNGHSRAFDAAADGYLRGEGCGVVAIRRLADAERDGDPILGVIRGSAVGHNGFSSGLTAPNPKAQEKVIRQALERAKVDPHDVAYLEAHGTGTELGDPIEMRAAAAAMATGRSADAPLLVGSVKTNIGHLEAAAGMAGLIKVLLSMQQGRIPGQLNFETPNPHIPWDSIPVQVLTEQTPWPQNSQRIAGVSAFGMSGTNAHVVLADPVVQKAGTEPAVSGGVSLLSLSGKSDDALREQAVQLEQALTDDTSLRLNDVAFTLGCRRSHFDHRAAVVATDRSSAIAALNTLSRGGSSDSVFVGTGRRPPGTAWQFTGQGSQYFGMARELYNSDAVFRKAIDWCEERLSVLRAERLTDVLFQHESLINHTSWTQPGIFAVQMGLARMLQARGLQPDAVMGHSVGQYAAACVAGVMSWEDGLTLIAERGRVIGELPSGGKMLAVFSGVDVVAAAIENLSGVSLAASNGTHAVVSGHDSVVEQLQATFSEKGLRCVPLTTSHAFHSERMDPILDSFAEFADRIEFQPALIPLVCNVSGTVLAADARLDGAYWAKHIREAVRFAEGVDAVQELGCNVLLELGPQGVLTRMAAANWKHAENRLISCLRKDGADQIAFASAIGRLYSLGHHPRFEEAEGNQGRHVILPTYPFQRRRFWGPDKPRAAHAAHHTAHPLLGGEVSLAGPGKEKRFESFVEPDSPAWLPDHEVMGSVVLPGAAFVEMALAASAGRTVEDLVFEQPLRPAGRTAMQTVVRTGDDNRENLETYSCGSESSEWLRHFTAVVSGKESPRPAKVDLDALQKEMSEEVEVSGFYEKLREIGLNYGAAFQAVKSLQISDESILARLSTNGDVRGFQIPPPILDAALHSLAVGLLKDDDGNLFLPVGMKQVAGFHAVEGDVWCHAVWTQNEGRVRTADLTLFADDGSVLLTIHELKVQQVSREVLRQMSGVGAERLLHSIQWKTLRLPAADKTPRRWMVVNGGGTSANSSVLTQALQDAGHDVVAVNTSQGAGFASLGPCRYELDATNIDHWNTLLDAYGQTKNTGGETADAENASARQPEGILWLLDGESNSQGDNLLDHAQEHCTGLITLSNTLLERGQRKIACGLQLVTAGAIASTATELCVAQQTQYWGLGRVIGAEQPEFRCRLIDLPAGDSEGDASTAAVLDILMTETRDNQLVIRDGGFLVPRLRKVTGMRGKISTPPVNASSSYLITGGLGMLGRQAAKWLADNGAGQVVLVSRRQPDEPTSQFLEEVRRSDCDVVVYSADLGDRDSVEEMMSLFGGEWKPLSGVIHAAGVLDDALIGNQTWERFERVLAPKIIGATLLDEATRDLSLDFFVLYSSAASVLGSPGQSNYATGNAFLDGLAWRRRVAGLPATSINWGPWSAGMADDERIMKRLTLQGIAPLGIDESHEVMGMLLEAGHVQATVMDVDWRRMNAGPGNEPSAMLEELAPARQKSQAGDSELVVQLRKLRGVARRQLLVDTVRNSLQRILSTPEPPELDRPLIEMGLDSLMAVEFGTELQQMLGDQFPVGPTMLFDHPTIDAISDHVLGLITDHGDETDVASESTTADPETAGRTEQEPIAVIGLSCRFPGARNADEFWSNLLNGVDSVVEIPEDRWDIDRFYREDRQPGFMYTRQGGFLDDIADFDAAFFNISDQEACWIDPQHRMLLENSYRALEDAGIASSPLADSNVGVFMGIMGQDYAFLPTLDDHHVIEAFQGAGLSHSAGVGRISYVFGFEGPSIAVDTASSSSLVALHQAMRSLQDGHCNMALAGGVNAILAPVNSLLMSKAGLLSPDGRCKSFSSEANGFGRGEGCGVVVLKRLSDAQRDGDRVLAVVKGGAVVHNGFTSGITSPSGRSQSRVIMEALKDAKVAPSQVQYLEAHGTGTEFGDPMELGAAATVYGKGRKRDNPLLVGSVKANISHLEAAGGVSGLIKTVLAIHHGVLPPQAHFDKPSPHIPWRRLPVQMVTETTAWPETDERLAGVTALGLVGTNAHVILGSAPSTLPQTMPSEMPSESTEATDRPKTAEASRPTELLTLSARSQSALRSLADAYVGYLSSTELSMADVCYTAAVGRRHYEHRLAVSVRNREHAVDRLTEFVATSRSEENGMDLTDVQTNAESGVAWLFGDECIDVEFARQLVAAEPALVPILDDFDDRLRQLGDEWSAGSLKEWFAANDDVTMPEVVITYVVQAAMAQLWQEWGIEPDAVAGVGVGQYVASAVSGGLCFLDALVLVARSAELKAEPSKETLDEFEKKADAFNYYPPNRPLVCSVSAELVPVHRSLSGAYWRSHVTAEPDVGRTVDCLFGQDFTVLMQFGRCAAQSLTVENRNPSKSFTHLKCLEANQTASSTNVETLGRLYECGLGPDFHAWFKPWKCRKVALPLYPFQKKRYWITEIDRHLESTESVNT